MTDIDKLNEDQANAMVAAMIASWKRSIDEVDRLRAELERLRAIEAAASEHARVCDLLRDEYAGQSLQTFAALQAALAAKGTP